MENIVIKEDASSSYVPRTKFNAFTADVTLALAVDMTTRGEQLTHSLANKKYIGFELNDETNTLSVARGLFKKLKDDKAKTLNIAGNGIYTLVKENCSQEFINQFVYEIISQTNYFYPITKIYTGGQTGVDIAGAIAAYKLGIPVEVTLPKGYIQRHEDGKDVTHTREEILEQVITGAAKLYDYSIITKEQLLARKAAAEQNFNNISNNTPANQEVNAEVKKEAPKAKQSDPYESAYQQPLPSRRRTFESLDDPYATPPKAHASINPPKQETASASTGSIFGVKRRTI